MKLFITSLILLAFTIQSALADQSVNINKGEKAPYTGVLLDQEKAEKLRDELIEKDALVKTNESLNKSIILYKSNEEILSGQKDMLLKQNISLTETLNDTRTTSDLVKVGYFVLGVAVTGLAVYGAAKIAK